MVLKTAAVDPVNYRRYIFYIFLGLLSTFLTIALAAVVRCCANRAPAKVWFFPSRYSLRIRSVSHTVFWIRIQHFRLNTGTDPDSDSIRFQGFDGQKLKKFRTEKFYYFFII
jgi:hypothetical protein